MLDRRQFLTLSLVGTGAAFMPSCSSAAATGSNRKLLFVIQRGAADGLATLSPISDPAFRSLRGEDAERAADAIKLGGDFALHSKLASTAELYKDGQALFVHAVATPYRNRSHFDGQNVLESGAAKPYALKSGWMNRLVGELGSASGVAIGPTIPLAMRGDQQVASYAPSKLPEASDDLLLRIGDLYQEDDQLGPLWTKAMEIRAKVGEVARGDDGKAIGALAAKLMAGPKGATIAMIESEGWDTHQGQRQRLNRQFEQLDALVDNFRQGMGTDWANTLVLVATEFGRTAASNGTGGTDHGTGSLAMLLGGAVQGGKIIGDWPGLRNLYEGRDLQPTTDLDALIASAMAQHFSLDPGRLSGVLFPETRPTALQVQLIA